MGVQTLHSLNNTTDTTSNNNLSLTKCLQHPETMMMISKTRIALLAFLVMGCLSAPPQAGDVVTIRKCIGGAEVYNGKRATIVGRKIFEARPELNNLWTVRINNFEAI